jgi:hypothetical protein
MKFNSLALAVVIALSVGSVEALAQTERVVTVPSGTYTFAQIITQSGTAAAPIRYRPATPGTVTIRGGEIRGAHYVTLDGFVIDGRLDTAMPTKSRGVDISGSSNIEITNSEIIGPNDIYTGYNADGQRDCQESNGALGASVGITSRADSHNITFSNVEVHGFYGAGALRGSNDRIVNSLFRNSFNGLGISSGKASLVENVFWVHPNHLFSLQGAGTVEFVNNLIVDSQDMIQAGKNWEGAQNLLVVHNTFYIPANKPCYGLSGITIYSITKTAVVRDNVLVNKRDGFLNVSDATAVFLKSNYNLYYNYEKTTQEFKFKDAELDVPYETWVSRTGEDQQSVIRQAPLFSNPPQYEDYSAHPRGFRVPRSVSEARSWFLLKDGSPGRNRASDGIDMGISRTTVAYSPAPLSPVAPLAPISSGGRPQPPTNVRIIQ